MTKDESTTQGMQGIENAVKSALDQAFDNGVASVPAPAPSADGSVASPGGITSDQEQADIAKAVSDASVALQNQITDLTKRLGDDDAAVAALQQSQAVVQAKLDSIKALLG